MWPKLQRGAFGSFEAGPCRHCGLCFQPHDVGQTLRTEKEVFNWLWESRQGAQFLYGPHLFLQEAKPNKACLLKANHTMIYGQETIWGPRPDFSKPEARRTKGCKMF